MHRTATPQTVCPAPEPHYGATLPGRTVGYKTARDLRHSLRLNVVKTLRRVNGQCSESGSTAAAGPPPSSGRLQQRDVGDLQELLAQLAQQAQAVRAHRGVLGHDHDVGEKHIHGLAQAA